LWVIQKIFQNFSSTISCVFDRKNGVQGSVVMSAKSANLNLKIESSVSKKGIIFRFAEYYNKNLGTVL
jgi:hypothetical protein